MYKKYMPRNRNNAVLATTGTNEGMPVFSLTIPNNVTEIKEDAPCKKRTSW